MRLSSLNPRTLAMGLVCLATLAAAGAQAQGLRPSGGTGASLSKALEGSARAVPGNTGVRSADFIVAVVNSEPVTNTEVRERMARVAQSISGQGGQLPSEQVLAREVLERLILEKAQLQSARDQGLKVDDYAVDQAAQNVARQNSLSVEQMTSRLASDGISATRFREELRNQLLLQRLREREVDGRVRVSELDIDQYIKEQRTSGDMSNTALNLGHVFIAVPDNAAPAVVAEREARAREALEKLRAGQDFTAVVREYSDGPEAREGGALGMRPAERYPELFMRAVGSSPKGTLAGPLRSGAGFHLLKVLDRSQQGVPAVVTQSHARHILLRPSEQLSEGQAAERLADYRRRVQTGQARFEDLAREYSQDGSAKQGGDLGWAGPGAYVPEFEEALAQLKPGEVGPPLVSRFGVHLIQLLERRQATLTPREQREMLRNVVREQKLDKAYNTWVQEVRGRAYVEYRDPPQ
ncbi:MAG: peptidylprolyl isomerase [Comamonas sp.]